MQWAMGVDFGGTNIKIGLVTDRGSILAQEILTTGDHATPQRFVSAVAKAAERLARSCRLPHRALRGLVLGAPGLIDAQRGVIRHLVNVPGRWAGVPLARLLSHRLACPCV